MKRSPYTSVYRVKQGDTLRAIARDQYGDPTVWPEIAHANLLRIPYSIFIGQKLRLFPVETGTSPSTSTRSNPPSSTVVAQQNKVGSIIFTQYVNTLIPPELRPARVFGHSITYNLEKILKSKQEITTSQFHIVLQLTGELTFKTKGDLPGIDVSNEGISTEIQRKAATRLATLTLGGSIKADYRKSAEVKCELAVASKIHGQVFATQTYSLIPPSTCQYTYKPKEVSGEHGGFEFSGVFGYNLTVTWFNQNTTESALARVPVTGVAYGIGSAVIGSVLIDEIIQALGVGGGILLFAL